MTFFISDLGRKFNRSLRESMITGNIIKHNKPSRQNCKAITMAFLFVE